METGITNITGTIQEGVQRRCKRCWYFRDDEPTGYCQYHHVHVLRTYDCPKFVPNDTSYEGGDA